MSLVEVAAAVAAHLRTHGIDVVVVGGSAITAHVPGVYTSMDIDFAVTSGINRRKLSLALRELSFQERGRVFVHSDTTYSLDFVADRPYIDKEAVYDFAEIPGAPPAVPPPAPKIGARDLAGLVFIDGVPVQLPKTAAPNTRR